MTTRTTTTGRAPEASGDPATTGAPAPGTDETAAAVPASSAAADDAPHPYVGMWVTADDRIRQELLPEGRYEEARGTVERAYTGRYAVTGTHIDYVDDTGFTADGTFDGDVLHHGGWRFYREGSAAQRAAARG
ncbi:Atu4866 domain-containing protein [Patulibacter americanus]|uniref:Atu4866 domain-containing protein n=1 Tax=Patulibacter americanus TaxID=588672 RepID=UPI0003B52B43|nr:Atu4866 domain-containing protein [Patulibacter americanus]